MAEFSAAWLLDVGAGMQAAVAENEIVEYLPSPQTHQVPTTPPYCSSVIFWRDLILPVFNLALLTQPHFEAKTDYLGILAYQNGPKTPLRHIGVTLFAPPEKILVSDEDAIDWPEVFPDMWRSMTRALFVHKGNNTPVLDIEGLCAGSAGYSVIEMQQKYANCVDSSVCP